jgi:hypothetical protein
VAPGTFGSITAARFTVRQEMTPVNSTNTPAPNAPNRHQAVSEFRHPPSLVLIMFAFGLELVFRD